MDHNRNNEHTIAVICINIGKTHHPRFPPSRIRFLSMTFPKSTHPQIEVAVDKHEDEEPSKITATINKMVSLEINWVN